MHRGVTNSTAAAFSHFPMVQAEFLPEVPLVGLQKNTISALMQVANKIGFYEVCIQTYVLNQRFIKQRIPIYISRLHPARR